MPTERDEDALAEPAHSAERVAMDKVAEEWGVQGHPHGDVEHWLAHNPEDPEEEGPVVKGEAPRGEGPAVTATRRRGAAEDNLVQLPIGGEFGMDHKPSPQEREDRLRFAAAADAELRQGRAGRKDEE